MVAIKSFEKILAVREKEKNVAHSAYHQSVQSFEMVANQLYKLLRQKEELEDNYRKQLNGLGQVSLLSSHSDYINKLRLQIAQLELKVNKARVEMQGRQEKLTEAHVEVKKFEKLIEQKKQIQTFSELKQEERLMDETSVLQYLKSRNR